MCGREDRPEPRRIHDLSAAPFHSLSAPLRSASGPRFFSRWLFRRHFFGSPGGRAVEGARMARRGRARHKGPHCGGGARAGGPHPAKCLISFPGRRPCQWEDEYQADGRTACRGKGTRALRLGLPQEAFPAWGGQGPRALFIFGATQAHWCLCLIKSKHKAARRGDAFPARRHATPRHRVRESICHAQHVLLWWKWRVVVVPCQVGGCIQVALALTHVMVTQLSPLALGQTTH